MPALEAIQSERRFQKAAAESYARLAARLNADPVQLAEADVLGLLYDAFVNVTSHDSVTVTLTACSKEGT